MYIEEGLKIAERNEAKSLAWKESDAILDESNLDEDFNFAVRGEWSNFKERALDDPKEKEVI